MSRPASLTQRRTPSSTRSAMTEAVWRSMRTGSASERRTSAQKLVTPTEIWSGASLTPTTWAAPGVAHRADLQRNDKLVVEERRGDGGNGGRAQFGQLRDLDPRHGAEAADRIHHVKAIDRAHQFRIGGLHRSGASAAGVFFIREAELFSIPRRPVNRPASIFRLFPVVCLDSRLK